MSIRGYDISNVNGHITIPSDAEFIIAKASQDSTFVDRLFKLNRTEARAREIGFGSYHYGDNRAQPDAEKSVEFYLYCVGEQKYGETGALDVERDYGYGGFEIGNPTNREWVTRWGEVYYSLCGFKPYLYTNASGLQDFDLDYPEIADLFELWLAHWPNSGQPTNPPIAPTPFSEYKLWQYNADTIDKNIFLGTLEEFRDTGRQPPETLVNYDEEYWTPMYDIIADMVNNSQYPHADAAFHAAISNAITLHKIAIGVEDAV